jgi:hypothetical protein
MVGLDTPFFLSSDWKIPHGCLVSFCRETAEVRTGPGFQVIR